jgi:hypothetical protein
METQQNNVFEQQISTIVQRLKIVSKYSFLVDNESFETYPNQAYAQIGCDLGSFGKNTDNTLKEARLNLTNVITTQLYNKFYCESNSGHHELPSLTERELFMDSLSAANCSRDGLDLYWKIYAVDPQGHAFAQKNGVLRQLIPNAYTYANPEQKAPMINEYVHFHRQKENRKAQPVFYYVYGDEYLNLEGTLARVYWHIKPEGAAQLVSAITNNLNFYNIPFNFKCLNHNDLYTRSDSAVLYFDKKHLPIIKIMLPQIVKSMEVHLNDSIPLFTQKLAKGVSFAEDPGNGQSFGMSRVQAISEALVEGFQQKIKKEEKLTDFILSYMESMGIHREFMYLNPRLQTS